MNILLPFTQESSLSTHAMLEPLVEAQWLTGGVVRGTDKLRRCEQLCRFVELALLEEQMLFNDAMSQLTQLLVAEHLLQQWLEHLSTHLERWHTYTTHLERWHSCTTHPEVRLVQHIWRSDTLAQYTPVQVTPAQHTWKADTPTQHTCRGDRYLQKCKSATQQN